MQSLSTPQHMAFVVSTTSHGGADIAYHDIFQGFRKGILGLWKQTKVGR